MKIYSVFVNYFGGEDPHEYVESRLCGHFKDYKAARQLIVENNESQYFLHNQEWVSKIPMIDGKEQTVTRIYWEHPDGYSRDYMICELELDN